MIKKSVLIFVILSVIASALNYLIYPLFGRILAPSEYVNVTLALSLFTQISAFLSSIIAITIGLSKDEENGKSSEKVELLQAFLFKLFIILGFLFLALSPLIMEKVNTPTFFALPIALMMLFSIPFLIISGYLNGKNKMITLGIVTLISASCQALIGITTALVTHSGLLTMLSMAIAQILTLIIVYTIFSKTVRLPNVIKSLRTPLKNLRGNHMNGLILYAALASFSIMAISLVQIADLIIIQGLKDVDVKFYTDLYVISRIVFFGGMIFVWPFLGEISLKNRGLNRKPFMKVVGYFSLITLSAVLILYFAGNTLAYILFGVHYDLTQIREIGILSITYKFFLLVLTSIILYFVVLRKGVAIWLAMVVGAVVFLYSAMVNPYSGMQTVLIWLNILTGSAAIIGAILLLIDISKKRSKALISKE